MCVLGQKRSRRIWGYALDVTEAKVEDFQGSAIDIRIVRGGGEVSGVGGNCWAKESENGKE